MKKENITIEEVEKILDEAFKDGKLNKSKLTVDFMDAFVGFKHKEDIDEWTDKCLAIPMVKRKIGGRYVDTKDAKKIREYFLEKYYPEYTEEGIKKAKAEKKANAEKAKEEKERLSKLTPEEKFRAKMEQYKK